MLTSDIHQDVDAARVDMGFVKFPTGWDFQP